MAYTRSVTFINKEHWRSFLKFEESQTQVVLTSIRSSHKNFDSWKKSCAKDLILTILFVVGGILLLALGPHYLRHVNSTVFYTTGGIVTGSATICCCLLAIKDLRKKNQDTQNLIDAYVRFEALVSERITNCTTTYQHLLEPNDCVVVQSISDSFLLFDKTGVHKEKILSKGPNYIDLADFIQRCEEKKE